MRPKNLLLPLSLAALASVVFPGTVLAEAAGVLVIAENETPENLDPANATNSTVDQLLVGVYDALVQFTAGDTAVTPRIAASWEISEDGLAYTFTLRDDVTFHDGSPLTAADVKFISTAYRLLPAMCSTTWAPMPQPKSSTIIPSS